MTNAGLSTRLTTEYVADCKMYSTSAVTADLECYECDSGYVLSVNKRQCYAESLDTGCAVFANDQDVSGCNACKTDTDSIYSLTITGAKKTCRVVSKDNCIEGAESTDASAKCGKCAPGYYLDATDNSCKAGVVSNCDYHTDVATCQDCASGYTRVTGLSNADGFGEFVSRDYCYPNVQNLGCDNDQTLTITAERMSVTCNVCDALANRTMVVAKAEEAPLQQDHLCAPFTPITNCATYHVATDADRTQNADATNFQCATCNSDYYVGGLISNQCVQRTSKFTDNCQVTNNTADECVECESGFYLNNNDKTCVKQPDGVTGCLSWNTSFTAATDTTAASFTSYFCVVCDTTNYTYDEANRTCVE